MKRFDSWWIVDNELGLEWSLTQREMTWQSAMDHARAQGYRLPTIKELLSIVDYEKREPALDREIFHDTKIDKWYWSSTSRIGKDSEAFAVSFVGGCSSGMEKVGEYYFRMVREIRK